MEHRKSIGFEIRVLNNLFMRKMESLALRHRDGAFTVAHGWVLGYLYHHTQKDIYQKDIEKEFRLSRSSVTCILKSLEEQGCIKRESVVFDARLKKIILLPRGVEIHKRSVEDINIMDDILEKNISKEDLEVFYRVTGQVRQNLIESDELNGKDWSS